MKTASAGYISTLNTSREINFAELYTITLKSGTIVRLCSRDFDVTVGGNTFSSAGPQVKRGVITTQVGLEVTSVSVEILATISDTLNGVPWHQAAKLGLLDDATVKIERVLFTANGISDVSNGTIVLFYGEVGDVEPVGRTSVNITVNSMMHRLDMQMPRNLVTSGCPWTVFDANCTLSAASFAVAATIASGSTKSKLIITGPTQATGYFDQGTLLFTSGANNGTRVTVVTYTNASGTLTILLNKPLDYSPSIGDTMTLYPGCDGQQATCSTKFSNLVNFGGKPYVPVPEAAI